MYFIDPLQGQIQPVMLREEIPVIFGSQVSLRVRYCERDKVYFTTLLSLNNGKQNDLISRTLFSELWKIMVNKVTFVDFRGGAIGQSPQSSTPDP